MNKSLALICFACLIFGFQNCSPTMLTADGAHDSLVGIYEPEVGPLDPPVSKVRYSKLEVYHTLRSPFNQLAFFRYMFDPATGEVAHVDDTNYARDRRCLSHEDLALVQAAWSSLAVCDFKPDVDYHINEANRYCSQVYTPAKAALFVGEKTIKIGESFDSCGKGQKVLCGDGSSVMEALINKIEHQFEDFPKCGEN